MTNTATKKFRRRVMLLAVVFTLVFGGVMGKVVQLQILDRSWLSGKAADSFKRISEVQGKRGVIFDAAYRELAVTLDVTDIGIHPTKITATRELARALAKALGLSWETLHKKLNSKASFVWLKRQASPAEFLAVKAIVEQYEVKKGLVYKSAQSPDDSHKQTGVTDIGIDPTKIKATRELAQGLAKALGCSWEPLYKDLYFKKSLVWLKRQASPDELAAVKAFVGQYELKQKFVYESTQSRAYPHKQLAGQVIGFVGLDGKGLEGLEAFYDHELKGRKTPFTYSQDGIKRKFELKKKAIADNAGHNVILNIDANIQYIAEEAVAKTVTEHQAKSGLAVVIAPKTGAVKAMAHFPLFDPNRFGKYRQHAWRNRIVTDMFEPGSTLKVFTIAAGLESRTASSDTVLDCENGRYYIGRIPIHDTHDYQLLTVSDIVKYSSNIGAAKLGQAMGKEVLYQTLTDFGYNQLTQIDCPGEVDGSLADFRRWRPIDAANIAFGQGVAVTAIQLATAMAAIANDGVMMQPQIVQAITDQNGVVVRKASPKILRRVISVETARKLQAMMVRVVEKGGTGTRATVKGFTVGGKTGTAQKIGPDGAYSKRDFVSSFAGFVPASRPELVILVVVDEPRKYTYGGLVAAPAFREIAQSSLNYLNIPMETESVKIAHEAFPVKKAKL